MTTPRIDGFEFRALDIPLLAPFGISGGSLASAQNALVTIHLETGTRGFGEAAPLPAYNGETQEAVLAALQGATDLFRGHPIAEWKELAAAFRAHAGARCGSAQCAVETALLDAFTRSRDQSMRQFFGGAEARIETDMTITTGTPLQASDAAADIRRRGIRLIKIKVGGSGGAEGDLERIDAILATAPGAPLILDGNAGLTRAAAATLARGLKDRKITPALLEQWLPKTDLPGLRALHEETGWTVAADESVVTADDARKVLAAKAAQVVNIKLMKAGVLEALQIVQAVREAGARLMIGGNVEAMLGMTMSACFATGLGGFDYGDLDTPHFLAANPFRGGFHQTKNILSVAHIDAGHGVVPVRLHR